MVPQASPDQANPGSLASEDVTQGFQARGQKAAADSRQSSGQTLTLQARTLSVRSWMFMMG